MKKKGETGSYQKDKSGRQPYHVRLPGFVTEKEIGLGEVIKRATSTFGISPCGGCIGRAEKLNRFLVFSRWDMK